MWMSRASSRSSSCDWTNSVLEIFFRLQSIPLEHIEEVGVAACVELIRAMEADPAVGEQARQFPVDDCRADLAFDVVTHDWKARVAKFLRPFAVRGEEHRNAIDQPTPASRQAWA